MPDTAGRQHADTIRENVSHIARGCKSGRSHNPAVYVTAIDAALDALAADAAAAQQAIYAVPHITSELREQRDAAVARADRLEARIEVELAFRKAAYVRIEELEQALRDLIQAVSNVIDHDIGAWHGSQLKGERDDARAALAPAQVNDGADYDTWEMATGAEGTA